MMDWAHHVAQVVGYIWDDNHHHRRGRRRNSLAAPARRASVPETGSYRAVFRQISNTNLCEKAKR
jgi:hypothetical protein